MPIYCCETESGRNEFYGAFHRAGHPEANMYHRPGLPAAVTGSSGCYAWLMFTFKASRRRAGAANSYSPSIVTVGVSVAVCEIFNVKEWRDLENQVKGHSRSLKIRRSIDRTRLSIRPPL